MERLEIKSLPFEVARQEINSLIKQGRLDKCQKSIGGTCIGCPALSAIEIRRRQLSNLQISSLVEMIRNGICPAGETLELPRREKSSIW